MDNIERRETLEFELEDAREVLRKTLCEECKTNLKSGTQKRKSGVTVRGKGKNAFLLSLLAVSVAMVAVVAPPKSVEMPITGPVPTDIAIPEWESGRRNLRSSVDHSLDTAL